MPKKTHLHRRDLAIMECLLDRRVETLDWLHRTYWPDATRKTARNRLWRLQRAGYLERIEMPTTVTTEAVSVYLLTSKAGVALKLRSLAAEQLRDRRAHARLVETSIPHQLATNRVGDWLGTALIPEHRLDNGGGDRHHRPDAAYQAASADAAGRSLVLVEVDLGHYTRKRVIGKLRAFLERDDARSILLVSPTDARSAQVARWIRSHYGPQVMRHVQPLTFEQIRAGGALEPGTEPATRSAIAPYGLVDL